MNLLKNNKSKESSDIKIQYFREHQYKLLPNLFKLMVNYVSKQNGNYLSIQNISIQDKESYTCSYNSELTKVKIDCSYQNNIKTFLEFYIPKLIDGSFFFLNGNYYVPALYILDKPISVKKNSIKLFSLFNSMTIYIKDHIATFTGVNIPVSYFFQLFMDEDNKETFDKVIELNKMTLPDHPEEDVINYFSNAIGCDKKKEDIINYFENLFLDDYTKSLYYHCYNLKNITLSDLIIHALKISTNNTQPEFIDLNSKRLVFIELLLSPIFKRIGNVAMQAARGFFVDEIRSDQLEIIKHFNKVLHSNYLYDCVNLFSAIQKYKVSLINPGSTNPPSSISDVHKSHYQILDLCAISNQRPGETAQLVPNVETDEIGQIIVR